MQELKNGYVLEEELERAASVWIIDHPERKDTIINVILEGIVWKGQKLINLYGYKPTMIFDQKEVKVHFINDRYGKKFRGSIVEKVDVMFY